MENKVRALGHVNKDGKIKIQNRDIFLESIKEVFKEKSIYYEVGEQFRPFSDSLRNYYFAVIVKEGKKAWEASGVIKSLKEVDQDLRERFLYIEELNPEKAEFEKVGVHTLKNGESLVSMKMMKDFIDNCIRFFATALEWVVAYPNEILLLDNFTENQYIYEIGEPMGLDDKITT
jgi:hypothetical protein